MATPAGATYALKLRGIVLVGSDGAEKATASNPMVASLTNGGLVYNSATQTLTNTQRADFQGDLNANLRVRPVINQLSGSDGIANSQLGAFTPASVGGSGGNSLMLQTAPSTFNGTGWDRVKKPNIFSRLAASAAGGSPTLNKSTAGDVTAFWGQNGAAATYLQIYNKTTAPVIGTDTPILTYPILASEKFSQQIPNGGGYCSTGIGFAFTTDAAGTTAAAANAVTGFALLSA